MHARSLFAAALVAAVLIPGVVSGHLNGGKWNWNFVIGPEEDGGFPTRDPDAPPDRLATKRVKTRRITVHRPRPPDWRGYWNSDNPATITVPDCSAGACGKHPVIQVPEDAVKNMGGFIKSIDHVEVGHSSGATPGAIPRFKSRPPQRRTLPRHAPVAELKRLLASRNSRSEQVPLAQVVFRELSGIEKDILNAKLQLRTANKRELVSEGRHMLKELGEAQATLAHMLVQATESYSENGSKSVSLHHRAKNQTSSPSQVTGLDSSAPETEDGRQRRWASDKDSSNATKNTEHRVNHTAELKQIWKEAEKISGDREAPPEPIKPLADVSDLDLVAWIGPESRPLDPVDTIPKKGCCCEEKEDEQQSGSACSR